jgi:hypothetical protein
MNSSSKHDRGPPPLGSPREKPISLALLIGAVLFLCLPTILSKSKQFMAAREASVEAA